MTQLKYFYFFFSKCMQKNSLKTKYYLRLRMTWHVIFSNVNIIINSTHTLFDQFFIHCVRNKCGNALFFYKYHNTHVITIFCLDSTEKWIKCLFSQFFFVTKVNGICRTFLSVKKCYLNVSFYCLSRNKSNFGNFLYNIDRIHVFYVGVCIRIKWDYPIM